MQNFPQCCACSRFQPACVKFSLIVVFFPFPFPPFLHVSLQGKYDQGIRDCDNALTACKESRQALYRKALCLKELGRYREAYDCTTDSLLISRLVKRPGFTTECMWPIAWSARVDFNTFGLWNVIIVGQTYIDI